VTKKVILIGAGSAVFTQGLVADMVLSPDLGPWELGLVDIDPQALETADKLSRRMVEARGGDIRISASTDRRDLLADADVVVCTIGVGGRRAWERDVQIPREYGVYQPVGDSVMPGGISRAMRMIPALIDIARDVQTLCPQAIFINYANPMTANCWAIRQATGVPVVGLCHGVFDTERQLAKYLGVPPGEVTSLAVGLNHLTFMVDLRWNGTDALPLLRRRSARDRRTSDSTELGMIFDETGAWRDAIGPADSPFAWSLFDTYGAFPAPGDRHVSEFFPERFPLGDYHGKTLGMDAYSLEAVTRSGDETYADMRAQAFGEKPLDEQVFERQAGEHEQLIEILTSIEGDQRRVFSANMPNDGAVPNLPADAILELPAAATATGLRPLQILDFPDPLAAIISRKLVATRLTMEAALAGDRGLLVEALLADGAVTDPGMAQQMGDQLLQAHRDHLPNFFES
jgi:alpha-galactosidase